MTEKKNNRIQNLLKAEKKVRNNQKNAKNFFEDRMKSQRKEAGMIIMLMSQIIV